MPSTKYTAEVLAPIVASSSSLSDVMRKLGLTPNGGNHRLISARVRQAGLDTSHFGRKLRRRIDEVPRERLVKLVAESKSIAQVLIAIEMPTEGRAHHELKDRLSRLAIDTSHFTGAAWSRGETMATHPSLARSGRKRRRRDEDVFVENATETNGTRLVRRLLAKGWPYCCAICGISEWQGKALVLHLDHINGINNDNRVENLRLFCPNCHSQTTTYCKRVRAVPSSMACESRAKYSCYTSGTRAWRNWLTHHI